MHDRHARSQCPVGARTYSTGVLFSSYPVRFRHYLLPQRARQRSGKTITIRWRLLLREIFLSANSRALTFLVYKIICCKGTALRRDMVFFSGYRSRLLASCSMRAVPRCKGARYPLIRPGVHCCPLPGLSRFAVRLRHSQGRVFSNRVHPRDQRHLVSAPEINKYPARCSPLPGRRRCRRCPRRSP